MEKLENLNFPLFSFFHFPTFIIDLGEKKKSASCLKTFGGINVPLSFMSNKEDKYIGYTEPISSFQI